MVVTTPYIPGTEVHRSVISIGGPIRTDRNSHPFGSRHWYSYTPKGSRLESSTYGPGGSVEETATGGRDREGNPTELITYQSNGAVSSKVKYTFDAEGSEIGTAWFDDDGRLKRKSSVSYDFRGNSVASTLSTGARVQRHSYAYEFDSVGNWIKKTILRCILDPDGSSDTKFEPYEVVYRRIDYWPQSSKRRKTPR